MSEQPARSKNNDAWSELAMPLAQENATLHMNIRIQDASDEVLHRNSVDFIQPSSKAEVIHPNRCRASIKTIPTEITAEIISYVIDDQTGKRQVAAVCKAWKRIILGTPTFWRRILVTPWNMNASSLRFLERTLELSGSTTLDVQIVYSTIPEQQKALNLHLELLVQEGIHRWRSLALTTVSMPAATPNSISSILNGRFESLRSLTLVGGYRRNIGKDVFEPLYVLIAATGPSLYEFECTGMELPALLKRPSIFKELKSLTCAFDAAVLIKPQFDVEQLYINSEWDTSFKPFTLPPRVQFKWIKLADLSNCGLQIVQELRIDEMLPDDQHTHQRPLNFPSLTNLTMLCGTNLRWILDMKAPELCWLRIISLSPAFNHLTDIRSIFQTESHRIYITPKHLELRMNIPRSDILIILNKWPQIEYLTLHLYSMFTFEQEGGFVGELLNEEYPLCPNLDVLRICIWGYWGDWSTRGWTDTAKKVLRARKGILPLWRIEVVEEGSHEMPRRTSITIYDV